uniref:F-box domain-containing protein n=1 Tax=Caenorhabditis japonica TaxID=281687 RepID=A0A8R1HWK9_CAEJA
MSTEEPDFLGSIANCDNDFFQKYVPISMWPDKQQRQEMYKCIGGFEKWAELNDDCKRHVIGFLNYWTRCNLSLCSKKDNELVKNTILFTSKEDGIRLKPDFNFEKQRIETLYLLKSYIELRTSDGFVRSWQFSAKGKVCRIFSKSYRENVYTFSNSRTISREGMEQEVWNIAKRVLSKARDDLCQVMIEGKWNPKNDLPANLSNVKVVVMKYKSKEECWFWLNILDPKSALDQFALFYENSPSHPVDFDHVAHPAVFAAKSVRISTWVRISDKQFLQLTATKIYIMCVSMSSDVFLEVLRRWVCGETDPDFSSLVVFTKEENNRETIHTEISKRFNSIPYEYRSYQHPRYEFFRKFRQFRCDGVYCEVEKSDDPLCIVSVLITTQNLVMMRTGFACVRDGKPSIEYKFQET